MLALSLGAGVVQAQDGGVVAPTGDGSSAQTADGTYSYGEFGQRDLSYGMAGEDVRTLNWLLKAEPSYDRGVQLEGNFDTPTDQTVRDLQQSAGLKNNGVVNRNTRKAIAKGMNGQLATWYGPGFWGEQTACGKTLKPTTIGVANKKLPCGTRVTFAYNGHFVRAKVIDRGPYNGDYKWDLTKKLAKKLDFLSTGAGKVRTAVVPASVAK